MRGALLALAVMLAVSGVARADGLPDADQAEIEAVITRQMEAFARDDGPAAFDFATPELRRIFGSAERFMAMVRGQYQPVYRPRKMQFGEAREADGTIVQEVGVIGPDGVPRTALYTMERQPDGTWRIAACVLLERASADS